MILLSQLGQTSPVYTSDAILMVLAALTGLVILAHFAGMLSWLVYGVGMAFRNSVRFGFDVWRGWLSWMPWPVFLILAIGLIAAGAYAVDHVPALAILLGGLTFLMGISASMAYIHLDLERYQVERGYKALHNPLKGQEPARDLANYGHQVGVLFLASAAVAMIGGFALLNQGLYWSIGSSWYRQDDGLGSYADFLVYALLSLYRIVDLLDLADRHQVVHLAHVQPILWPASILLTLYKTLFTCVLLEQLFSSVRKGRLLAEMINDFFSPHHPIHERARQALPQYGISSLKPLIQSLRIIPGLTKEQRLELPKLIADIGPATIPGLLAHLKDPNDQVRAVAASALGLLQALEALPNLTALETDASEAVRLSRAEALGAIVKPGAKTIRQKLWFLSWQSSSPRSLWRWRRQPVTKLGTDPIVFVVNHLRRSLADTSSSVRTMVAKTLGDLGKAAAPAAVDLLPLLTDPEETVRLQVLQSLNGLGADPHTTVQAILPLLQDASAPVRAAAAETLGAFPEHVELVTPALVPLLHDRDESVRQTVTDVLSKMGSLSTESTSSLVEGLTSPDAQVRARTAEAIGNIGAAAESAAPALVLAAEDGNDRVRAKAVKALGKLGEGAAEAALPKLLRALHDRDSWVQALAAEALGEMGETAEEAIPALIRSLEHPNAQVRYHAAESLGKLGPNAEPAFHALQKACRDTDAGVRAVAVRGVAEVSPAAAEEIVTQACHDADSDVRLAALAACASLAECTEATRGEIFGLLEDANVEVKMQAAQVLSKLAGAEPALLTCLTMRIQEDDNVTVRVHAAGILGSLGSAAVGVGADLAKAAATQEASVREAALKALVQIQSPEAPAAFILGLQDEVADIRMVASAGWRKAASVPEEAIPGLVRALHDQDRQVRANAAYALNRVAVLPSQALPMLIECSTSPSDEVRLNAALALLKGDTAEVSAVMDRLLGDPVPRIRLAAAGFILGVDPSHAAAREVVSSALSFDSTLLRKVALNFIRSLGPNGLFSLPALRDRVGVETDALVLAEVTDVIAELEALQVPDADVTVIPTAELAPPPVNMVAKPGSDISTERSAVR